ncbi:Glycosyl hydrolases family 16 [Alkalibacterium subtropicum]|uniref:Beta-glucanase n=1 Tax=Alkalibacterium subtropicum TaxID=753702 RepID=A0A1I1I9Q2_9LACT|nr:glycoside hydrolase family 16 protein [Alkalibacterium subtropicum]SFC33109.1 Glycosyl hydrolases family 16 [Alkalibacterium subtropicum]
MSHHLTRRTRIHKRLLFFIPVLLFIIFLYFNAFDSLNTPVLTNDTLQASSYAITAVTFHSNVYTKETPLNVSVEIAAAPSLARTLWLGFSIVSPLGNTTDFPLAEVTPEPGGAVTFPLAYLLEASVPDDLTSGPYTAVFSLWDSDPITKDAVRLAKLRKTDAFRLYNDIEHFQTFDDKEWYSRNGQLGRTLLKNGHVAVSSDRLTIRIPANTLEGGEIQTTALRHFGSYEVSMKLPDAPSSITGFFLYKAPDFHHEIDIEIFNQPESNVLFTSYHEGMTQHENKTSLAFDPTAGFHRYRIDHYPDRVSFYIDDTKVQSWDHGFTMEPMHLMVNTWFPEWLDGLAPEEDQKLYIEWIRY